MATSHRRIRPTRRPAAGATGRHAHDAERQDLFAPRPGDDFGRGAGEPFDSSPERTPGAAQPLDANAPEPVPGPCAPPHTAARARGRLRARPLLLLLGLSLPLLGWAFHAELYKVAAIGGNGVVLCVLLMLPLIAAYFSYRVVRVLLRRGWKLLSGFFLCFSLLFCGWVSVNVGAALVCDAEIDAALARLPPATPVVIYLRRGREEVAVHLPVERSLTVSELVASHSNYAVPAIEDERLRSRWEGVIDLRALLRALRNFLFFRRREGASTILIQTAKWVRIKNRRQSFTSSAPDKLSQWFLALRLSQRFPSPEEQLALYLNLVEVDGTHGVAYAAVDFFGLPLQQLSVNQSALLAGLLNNPTDFNPRAHPRAALARRNVVLDKMAEHGLLQDAPAHKAAPLELADPAAAAELLFYARAARKRGER